ncbi:MAG TPA: hypothetical protein VK254_04130 [Candidatus Bathyarchaeia archaeon]|nr:hypothetical protein [Candidatus Bathyarchaeia archaeon]
MSLFSKKKKKKIPQKSWQRKGMVATSSGASKQEKKRQRSFSRFLFWLLLVVFFGICAYLVFFSPFLEVEKIFIEGNQDTSSADTTRVVENSLDGKYFRFLPKKNFFLASKISIENALKDNFGRLEVQSVEKIFPKTVVIKVIERKAELIWCSGGVCYFADKDGVAYGGAAGTEEELRAKNFLVVVDDSAIPVEIGRTKINPDYVGFVEAANSMIRNYLKIDPAESFHTPGIASGEISVKTSEGWTLKLSSEYSTDEAKNIIQMLFEKNLNEESRKKLDYLDIRVKNKIYYKMR